MGGCFKGRFARKPSAGESGVRTQPLLRLLIVASGTTAKLCSDAHLAALALERGATLAICENNFRRYGFAGPAAAPVCGCSFPWLQEAGEGGGHPGQNLAQNPVVKTTR